MTVEFQKRDFLNRTVERQVLPVGAKKRLQAQSLATPDVSLEVLSPDTVVIEKTFSGEKFDQIVLTGDEINKSPHTFSYRNRFNIAYKRG